MNKLFSFIVLTFIFLNSLNIYAFENLGSVSTALGGAGVGSVIESDGAFNNPASIAFFGQKTVALSYGSEAQRISFADNGEDSLFPAMIGYSRNSAFDVDTESFYLGFAYSIKKLFSVGANFSFQSTKIHPSTDKERHNAVDVGLTYRPQAWLSMGLVLKNKPLKDSDLPDAIDDRPSMAAGLEMQYMELTNFRAEIESGKNAGSDQKLIYKFGLESYINEWFFGRIGYQNNNLESQNYFTAGIGLGGSQFGLHYAYTKESELQKDEDHSIDLIMPF